MSFGFPFWGDWSKLSPTNLIKMKANICDSGSSYSLTEKGKEYLENIDNTNDVIPEEVVFEPKEWITVEGYKGFSNRLQLIDSEWKLTMCGHGNYIYNEIGEPNYLKDWEKDYDIKPCDSGLHFCLNLKDVFSYYNPIAVGVYSNETYNKIDYNQTVFAHVTAEIKKNDLYSNDVKKVARKIIINKIIPYEEIWDAFVGDNIGNEKKYPFVSGDIVNNNLVYLDRDSFIELKTSIDEHLNNQKDVYNNNGITSSTGCNDMTELIRQFNLKILKKIKINKRNNLVALGYSETFALMLLELYPTKYEKAVVFAEEGLSKDMRTYLLFKDNK